MAERPAPASLTRPESGDEHARLTAQLARARNRLTGELNGIGDVVNLGQRFQNSVRRNPGLWIGAGIAAGILIANLSRSPRGKEPGHLRPAKSLFFGLLGLAGREILRQSGPGIARLTQQTMESWARQTPRRSRHRPPHPANHETPGAADAPPVRMMSASPFD